MTQHPAFEIALEALAGIQSVWILVGLFAGESRRLGRDGRVARFCQWAAAEMRILIPPIAVALLFMYAMKLEAGAPYMWYRYLIFAMVMFIWWTSRNDDDRWKRRRKKLAGKVQSLGHRLVVAPAEGSA